ncbi:MAG: hypothetical protein V3S66_00665 [Desulfobacterales bacterium]
MFRKMIILPLLILAACLLRPDATRADFTFIIPQEPGGGTSIWAQIVAAELEKKLNEKIILRHIPGARDRIGFEKFHHKLRHDDKVLMVSHGGNAESFLQEKVTYNYADYEPIAIMNNNIIVSRLKKLNWQKDKIIFPERSGTIPESMALALLVGGPDAWSNWKERVIYVKGMSTPECRLAFRRQEINVTRENPAAHQKHVQPIDGAVIFFNHGLFNSKASTFSPDPNFPDSPTLEELYTQVWGQTPKGPLYDAYKMAKAWRDGVQKALWVNKGNPNRDRLRHAVKEMLADQASLSRIHKRMGIYPWHVGNDAQQFIDALYPLITKEALKTLVDFNKHALGIDSFFNEDRVWVK